MWLCLWGTLFGWLPQLGGTQQQPAAPEKKILADNLQLCDKTEGTVQSEVWPYNIYKAFWLNIESIGYSSTRDECECDSS